MRFSFAADRAVLDTSEPLLPNSICWPNFLMVYLLATQSCSGQRWGYLNLRDYHLRIFRNYSRYVFLFPLVSQMTNRPFLSFRVSSSQGLPSS